MYVCQVPQLHGNITALFAPLAHKICILISAAALLAALAYNICTFVNFCSIAALLAILVHITYIHVVKFHHHMAT